MLYHNLYHSFELTTTDGRDGRTEDDDDDGTDAGRTQDRTEDDDDGTDDGRRRRATDDGRRRRTDDKLKNYHISNEFQWFLRFYKSNLGIKHTIQQRIHTIFCMSKATYISNGFHMLCGRLVA